MRIWITGSAGFLGSRLARRLSAAGHEVLGLSRRRVESPWRSVEIDLAAGGVGERLGALVEESGQPNAVVHTASRQPGIYSITEFLKSNVRTTENLIEALKNFPPRQLIYTSTLSVYSPPKELPVKETHPACGPLPYAATKRWAEQFIETFRKHASAVVLRLPSLYGVGQDDSFIDGLARLAMKDEPIELFSNGRLVRDALHVDDVIEAVVSTLERPPEVEFSCMNLGCGQRLTTREYAEALVEALGSRSPVVHVDRPASQFDLYADIAEARRLIGFRPRPLEESMRAYRDELQARP